MPIARQPMSRGAVAVPFDKRLTTANIPENLIAIPLGFTGVSIALWVVSADARIAFDVTADSTGLRIQSGAFYQDAGITIRNYISFVGDPSNRPRVYGVVWCVRN